MPSVRAHSPVRGTARCQLAHELAQLFLQRQPVMMADFAAEVGRSPTLVRRLLEEAGVSTGVMMCVGMSDAELAPLLSARYESGVSLGALSRETGIDRRRVGDLVAQQGTTLRVPRRKSLPATQVPWIVEQYRRRNATLRGLAELTGFSYSTVRRELLKAGVTMRTPPGKKQEGGHVVETKD